MLPRSDQTTAGDNQLIYEYRVTQPAFALVTYTGTSSYIHAATGNVKPERMTGKFVQLKYWQYMNGKFVLATASKAEWAINKQTIQWKQKRYYLIRGSLPQRLGFHQHQPFKWPRNEDTVRKYLNQILLYTRCSIQIAIELLQQLRLSLQAEI